MKYFTSYYANYRNIPSTFMCVGISRTCPEGLDGNENFTWVRDSFLAPSAETLSRYKDGAITKEQYCAEYVPRVEAGISKFGCFDEWKRRMEENFQTYDAIVFMCYEKPGAFCHRRILAGIFSQLGIECPEFEMDAKSLKQPSESASVELF